MLVEDTGFVGPVPVAVTTVRLVREAEIQLRRPCLHLIPLELRTPSPRPITLVNESTKCIEQKSLSDREPKRIRKYDGTHVNIASYITDSNKAETEL